MRSRVREYEVLSNGMDAPTHKASKCAEEVGRLDAMFRTQHSKRCGYAARILVDASEDGGGVNVAGSGVGQ